MPDPSVHTTQLHDWLGRMRAGDRAAGDELLRAVWGRLERLARRMLRGYPNVRRWADTDDVLQSVLLRLLQTLAKIEPASTREFFNLAAEHIRRELLDLARRFASAKRRGAYQTGPLTPDRSADPVAQLAGQEENPEELDLWARFHEQ